MSAKVLCDICGKDFSESTRQGGILFETKAVGPCCESRVRAHAARLDELQFIRGMCPAGKQFRNWVIELRSGKSSSDFVTGDDARKILEERPEHA